MGSAPTLPRFISVHLLVTGKGEERFLPKLFTSLMERYPCTFRVLGRISQLNPITSDRRQLALKLPGGGKRVPTRDEEQIAFPARRVLSASPDALVLVIDDLEEAMRAQAGEKFRRYRDALDTLPPPLRPRASAHFLVNMLEAYYFADARALNLVLGTQLKDHGGDVEQIRHPKNDLKRLVDGFNEIQHGERIVEHLDLPHVLERPETCASLRTLVAWCVRAMGYPPTEDFRLTDGALSPVTRPQFDVLPEVTG